MDTMSTLAGNPGSCCKSGTAREDVYESMALLDTLGTFCIFRFVVRPVQVSDVRAFLDKARSKLSFLLLVNQHGWLGVSRQVPLLQGLSSRELDCVADMLET